jgi:hypothetical protein
MKRLFTLFSLLILSNFAFSQVLLNDDLGAYTTGTSLSGQGTWNNNISTVGGGGSCGATASACSYVVIPSTNMTYSGYSAGSGKALGLNGFSTGDNPGRTPLLMLQQLLRLLKYFRYMRVVLVLVRDWQLYISEVELEVVYLQHIN